MASPVAFYNDKHSIFRVNTKGAVGGDRITQFSRALAELNIDGGSQATHRGAGARSGAARGVCAEPASLPLGPASGRRTLRNQPEAVGFCKEVGVISERDIEVMAGCRPMLGAEPLAA
jgi:hypothetical protein